MQTRFVSKIRIANKNGTGFLRLPEERCGVFGLHDTIEIFLNEQRFFAQVIKWVSIGIYIPKEIAKDLFGKEVSVRLRKIDGSYAKVGYDGRIYLSLNLADRLKLKNKDIVLFKIFEDYNKIRERYSEVNVRKRGKKIEYMCLIGADLARRRVRFDIEKKCPNFKKSKNCIDLSDFLNESNFTRTHDGNLVVFKRKLPVFINPEIDLSYIALYLGAYYSDGTKKGNNWAISASTFEQANFYLKMHNFLVKKPKLEFVVSYTDIRNENWSTLEENLKSIWAKKVGNYPYKFRIRHPRGKRFAKCTKYGTLTIREPRMALLDFYNFLLEKILQEIKISKSVPLAIDFICGILEGDGCVAAKKRGHLLIATNANQYKSIANVLDSLEIKYKILRHGENKYTIRIGTLEILRNFNLLKDKIFALYPKRRKRLFERLQTVGTVKFLLGYGHEPTGWVKAWLKENGFVDSNYELTEKGRKLRTDLLKCIKSVTVK